MQLRRLVRLALAAAICTVVLGQGAVVVATTPTLVLPDLTMLAPSDIRIELKSDGRKLLRFTTVAVNLGPGPFQVVGFDTDGYAGQRDVLHARQQIKRSDGSWTDRATNARMMWAGDGHDHWHILGYQSFRLQLSGVFTLKLAAKTGFCAFDSYVYTSIKPAFYTWEKTCKTKADGTVFMGTAVKWGDIYKWNLAFQWFDITGLPIGDYTLKVVADPAGMTEPGGYFLESNETNNEAWTSIRIGKTTVTILARSPRP
jgi:Lysyl oxidase